MKIIELFAGIGSQTQALKNIGVEHEVIGISEIDKHAVRSYEAIHGDVNNLGDICKIEKLPHCDLLTYSFPCQDLSVAGKGAGIKEGTRSGLLLEVERLLEVSDKPKYLLMENVKNLVGKKNKPDFERWCEKLESMGYTNYWKVLNAKHYGIPQNRERVFMISVLGEHEPYEFPEGFDNGMRLKDMLEDEVDEKFYISGEKVEKLISQIKETGNANTNPSGRGMNGKVHIGDISPTLTTNKGEGPKMCIPCLTPDRIEKRQNGRRFKEDGEPMFTLTGQDRHGVLVKQATKQGYDIAYEYDSINLEQPNSQTRRGRVGRQIANTLTCGCNQAVVEPKIICEQRTDEGLRFFKDNVCGALRTIDACGDKRILEKQISSELNECIQAGSLEHYGNDQMNRYYDPIGISPTITVVSGGGREQKIIDNYRIRKLTPLECWRLMGFQDEHFNKAQNAGISNSQLYKQAGNSIVVDVLEHIFTNLFKGDSDDNGQNRDDNTRRAAGPEHDNSGI